MTILTLPKHIYSELNRWLTIADQAACRFASKALGDKLRLALTHYSIDKHDDKKLAFEARWIATNAPNVTQLDLANARIWNLSVIPTIAQIKQTKVLDLRSTAILKDGDVKTIAKAFPQLEALHLTSPFLTDDSITAIGENCPKLTVLTMEKAKLKKGLGKLKNLREISLAQVQISSQMKKDLAKQNPTKLDLYDTGATDNDLLSITGKMDNLRHLTAGSAKPTSPISDKFLAEFAPKHPLMQTLKLHYVSVTLQGISTALTHMNVLTTFAFVGCKFGDKLLQFLASTHHFITSLDLTNSVLTNQGVQDFARSKKPAKNLSFFGTAFGDSGFISILENIKRLESLDATGTQLTLQGLKEAPFKKNLSLKLHYLGLDKTNIEPVRNKFTISL